MMIHYHPKTLTVSPNQPLSPSSHAQQPKIIQWSLKTTHTHPLPPPLNHPQWPSINDHLPTPKTSQRPTNIDYHYQTIHINPLSTKINWESFTTTIKPFITIHCNPGKSHNNLQSPANAIIQATAIHCYPAKSSKNHTQTRPATTSNTHSKQLQQHITNQKNFTTAHIDPLLPSKHQHKDPSPT